MKKKDLDVLGILLGLVVGIVLGFFISSRVIDDKPVEVSSGSIEDDIGFVYLVEVAQFDNATGPVNYMKKLNELNFNAISLEKDGFYHIYTGVFKTIEEANGQVKILEENEYTPKVVKKYMLDITSFIVDENLKSFYDYCIDCFLLNMEGKSFTLTDEIIENQVDISLVQSLMMLNALKKEENISKLRLQIFNMISKIE